MSNVLYIIILTVCVLGGIVATGWFCLYIANKLLDAMWS